MLFGVPRMLAQSCAVERVLPSSEKQCGGRSREGAAGRACPIVIQPLPTKLAVYTNYCIV